jgi:hypothetical protein
MVTHLKDRRNFLEKPNLLKNQQPIGDAFFCFRQNQAVFRTVTQYLAVMNKRIIYSEKITGSRHLVVKDSALDRDCITNCVVFKED